MKKLRNNVFVYMFLMLAFLVSMLFGIFYGPSHPQLFFWMIMTVFAGVVAMYVATTIKDLILLIVGMILLGVVGQLVDEILLVRLPEGIFKFIVQCICMAPIYCPLAMHFVKMSKTRQLLDEDVVD